MSQNFWSNIQGYETMSYTGAMQKIGILGGICVASSIASAVVAADAIEAGNGGIVFGLMALGFLGGLVSLLVLLFTRPKNPVPLMSAYAVLEGMLVGSVSLMYSSAYDGIVLQAGLGTLAIFVVMYGLYAARILKATPMFTRIVISLTGGIFILYMMTILLNLFTGMTLPFLHSTGPLGIGISVFILGVASLNLILDFGFIERGVENKSPKVGEWWAALGLLVTLIWIYFEVLRLLSKIRSNMD
tara:strand:+ start:12810 stop:13541 length:732 start_codon:yes stop_codon:yes gene_type:complete